MRKQENLTAVLKEDGEFELRKEVEVLCSGRVWVRNPETPLPLYLVWMDDDTERPDPEVLAIRVCSSGRGKPREYSLSFGIPLEGHDEEGRQAVAWSNARVYVDVETARISLWTGRKDRDKI